LLRSVKGSHSGVSPSECLGLGFALGEKCMEGLHQLRTVREETVIKVHESNELAEMVLGLGLWKVTDSLNFLR